MFGYPSVIQKLKEIIRILFLILMCSTLGYGDEIQYWKFLNNTNNSLECINQKLKSVIPRCRKEFIEIFFLILRVLRSEREHKAALTVQKVPVVFHSTTTEGTVNYMKFLTPYGYQFVAKQMNLVNKVKISIVGNDLHLSSSEGVLETTVTSCTCCSWLSMKLPCRHIFAMRMEMKLDVYDESLCDRRWTMEYYRESQRIFNHTDIEDDVSSVEVLELPAPKSKSLSQVRRDGWEEPEGGEERVGGGRGGMGVRREEWVGGGRVGGMSWRREVGGMGGRRDGMGERREGRKMGEEYGWEEFHSISE